MSAEERAEVVKLLEDSRKEFLGSIQDLTGEQWNYRPAPFRWTIGQVSEHIVLAEGSLFQAVTKAVQSPPNPDWESKTASKTAFLNQVMPTRVGRAQAPWEIQPKGGLSKEEVIRRYNEVRGRTLDFAKHTDVALKEHTLQHPFPVFGTLNAYQWLIYIPLHNQRHDKQIAEVKASPGYPK
ncbi:MAG TPA: DinB family protein [Blastocatellia bacterium]|nr:DinB family protein [Blastocatellia bacterium]